MRKPKGGPVQSSLTVLDHGKIARKLLAGGEYRPVFALAEGVPRRRVGSYGLTNQRTTLKWAAANCRGSSRWP